MEKGSDKRKAKIYCFMTSFYFLKAYKGEGINFSPINAYILCERMLRPDEKIVLRIKYFHF